MATKCAICRRPLKATRVHVDTCGDRCFRILLERQRDEAFGPDRLT